MRKVSLPVLVFLSACSPEVVYETANPDDSTVTLSLQNPTAADPLAGVTSFRVDVIVDGEVAVSQSFDSLETLPAISNLDEYGVVRFEVAGLGGGQVLSFGRSAPVLVDPGQDQLVPITFLPVNQVLSLTTQMVRPRSRHAAVRLLDGRVAFFGGLDPRRRESFDDAEVLDPATMTFSALGSYLPIGVGSPTLAWTDEQALLISGGEVRAGDNVGSSRVISTYDPIADTISQVTTFVTGRRDHCLGQYLPTAYVVLGGPGTTNKLEVVHDADEGWNSIEATLLDGLQSEDVTVCGADDGQQVFVHGVNQNSTGVWDGTLSSTPGQAFTPVTAGAVGDVVYSSMPILRRLSSGVFWVAGGVDTTTNRPTAAGTEFRMASRSYVTSTSLARPRARPAWDEWIEDGWVVVGCGFSDVNETQAETSVELVNPSTGESGPRTYTDRARLGCQVTTLTDGSVLVTGGYGPDDLASASTAALFVPYFGE